MNILKGLSKYAIIIFVGIVLAFFVARIQYDARDLSASVLSITEQDFFESTKWDAWYKKKNQVFEVFLAEQVRNEWKLMVSIIFSPIDIVRFIDEIDTKYSLDIVENKEWNLVLSVEWYKSWDLAEWIFELPYSWDSMWVALEYVKSQNKDFAIWSLDDIWEDEQIH